MGSTIQGYRDGLFSSFESMAAALASLPGGTSSSPSSNIMWIGKGDYSHQ